MRLSNKNKLLIAHLNINLLRNKFEALNCVLSRKIDILIIAERKIDDTVPTNPFCVDDDMPPQVVSEGKKIFENSNTPFSNKFQGSVYSS